MTSNISSWVRKAVLRRKDSSNPTDELDAPALTGLLRLSLPRLPSQRAGQLTPSASREDLSDGERVSMPQDQSVLFRLPPELRRKILEEAFGRHVVHLDLSYDHPPLSEEDSPDAKANRYSAGHAGTLVDMHGATLQPKLGRDTSAPKQWIWQSSVCHRGPPHAAFWLNSASHAAEDQCRNGLRSTYVCQSWPGEMPHKCLIGAMGWLKTCRRAYQEGIEVLYGTNTFHTASQDFMVHLESLLLPQRRAAIRSVELLWDCPAQENTDQTTASASQADKTRRVANFERFCSKLPELFPNARYIYLSVQGHVDSTFSGSTSAGANRRHYFDGSAAKRVFESTDKLAERLGPHVSEFYVALSSIMYRRCRMDAEAAGDVTIEYEHLGQAERHWRKLQDSAEDRPRDGYWVYLGDRDMHRPYMCSMGEAPPRTNPVEEDVFYWRM